MNYLKVLVPEHVHLGLLGLRLVAGESPVGPEVGPQLSPRVAVLQPADFLAAVLSIARIYKNLYYMADL